MPWLILFLPLIASIVIAFVIRSNQKLSAFVAIASITVSLLLAVRFYFLNSAAPIELSIDWILLPSLTFEFGLLFNSLAFAMLFIVLSVSIFVFYYSIEYMEDDPGFSRYFACLSLFVFSMLGIVLSNNFLELFIFWELVGVSSYLLIGFWYQKNSAADAGKKAFITNRLGDYGFLLGIILLWTLSLGNGSGTLNLNALSALISSQTIANKELITTASLLIFCGVVGKSAQFPLHVWLPDAMEGPTPVSALIHAATMVAAGIYLLARTFFLFSASPAALQIISYLGGFTAIFAALQALVQTDIKRVLAYSTLSQLGYMVMAIGLGSSGVAMYHLTTHAFFKALLFLCAGSVIHATHEQDLTEMGGLFKYIPITGICFLIGALSLAGVYPLSGFWSKDEILSLAHDKNIFLFWISIFTAFLTAFYITRASVLTFFGKSKHNKSHAHEPNQWMTLPMLLLLIPSIAGGWLHIPKWFLNPLDYEVVWNSRIAILSSIFSAAGILLAILFYQLKPTYPEVLKKRFSFVYQIFKRGFFIDEFYTWFLKNVQTPFSELLSQFEYRVVVERLMNGTAALVSDLGGGVRKLQTGRIQTYTTVFFSGVVVILYLLLLRGVL